MNENVNKDQGLYKTELVAQDDLAKGEAEASAHLGKYLDTGESLIWADRAVSSRLVFHYIVNIVHAALYILLLPLVFMILSTYLSFPVWLSLCLILIGFLVVIYFIVINTWGLLYSRSHYYGLTSSRVLIAIGPYAPKSFTNQDIDYLKAYGPEDSNKHGKIYLFSITNKDNEPNYSIKCKIYGIKNAHWVAELIQHQLFASDSEK